jgi:hypothetical protein
MTNNRKSKALLPRTKSMLEVQENLLSLVERDQDAITQLGKSLIHHQKIIETALGPFEDMRQISRGDFVPELTRVAQLIEESSSRFQLPVAAELDRIAKQFETTGVTAAMKQLEGLLAPWRETMGAMHHAWLDTDNTFASIKGFVELQEIGKSLSNHAVYETKVAETIRSHLGDWRDRITWPNAIFGDLTERTSFYQSLGLDSALTAFPRPAFLEGIKLAGLYDAPPHYALDYRRANDQDELEQETSFARTNEAHDRLQRFETRIRQFIELRMVGAFGDNWIKTNIPAQLRDKWIEKKEKARKAGRRLHPLIAYADFTDYIQIIEQKNNWTYAFASVFLRLELVRESFQRLYPIRIETMHARLIMQDDELYLYVEVKRLLDAIGSD